MHGTAHASTAVSAHHCHDGHDDAAGIENTGRAPLRGPFCRGQDGKALETERRGALYARRCIPNGASKGKPAFTELPAPMRQGRGSSWGEETAELNPSRVRARRLHREGGRGISGSTSLVVGEIVSRRQAAFCKGGPLCHVSQR